MTARAGYDVQEATFEQRGESRVLVNDGWFVLNARQTPWMGAEGRSKICDFEGAISFSQVGINLSVLAPGQAMSMYHWEADQEDFLVISGEALLIVEGEERPLVAWDFVHFPPGAAHVIVGAGTTPCVLVAVGARQHQTGDAWGGYPVDATAQAHDAGVERETVEADVAYSGLPRRRPVAFDPDWLGLTAG